MPYPTTKTELGVPSDEEILRSNNVAEVLLADDVVYGHAVDALKYTRKDERFHALMKFEAAKFGTEKEPMPTINVRYELWRLDKDKLEEFMRKTIGMCKHTMDTYEELESVGIVSNVENREWRHYTDSRKMVELHRCEANGHQVFGFCETCEAQWRANGGLHTNLLKHYVNRKRYIHPFIRSRKDELDKVVVTEKVQFDYARYRLVHGLAHCIIGNEAPLVEEVEGCYVLEGPLAKETYEASSYGILNEKRLTKIQSERFKNFVLFDTEDSIHQNKKRSKDIDISGVEHRRLKSWLVREDLHAFEVKYSKLRQRRGLEKLGSIRLGGYTEDEVELFCVGASDEAVAKKWRETISSEIPTRLEPKIEYQSGVKQLDSFIAAIKADKAQPKLVNIYPAVEQSKSDAGEEFTCKWEKVCDVSETDNEAAYICLSQESFPCNVRDVRFIVAGMRNYYATLDRREEDEYDFDSVELAHYQGYETRIPVFEQEIFGNSLIALDVNFGPAGDKNPYGVVKQAALVTARVRSQYEPGFPVLPYRFVPTFGHEAAAKTIADAVYTFGHRWLGGENNRAVQTTWDRWFAVRKGFWMEKTVKDDLERTGVRATWTATTRAEADKVVESRKTWLEEAKVARLDFMYLKADDTTVYIKTKGGKVPHSYLVRQMALDMLNKACIPIANVSDEMIEAKALSLANVGHNTQFWSIRTGVLNALVGMLAGLSKRNRDDVNNCTTQVCQAIDKLLLGVRAQIFAIAALKWSLSFFKSILKVCKVLAGQQLDIVEQFLQTWRMFLPVIEKVEVPSAMQESERQEYVRIKKEFVEVGRQIDAGGYVVPPMQSVLLGDDVLNAVLANIIREKGGKNKTIENRLRSTELSSVMDVLKVGVLGSQVEDYTAEVALFVAMNKDSWTCLPDLEIERDRVTNKMLRRSIQCLRTPLAGQFLYQLETIVQEAEE